MDAAHHLHTAYHAAKDGKPLPIGVAGAAVVERRLVADADEEVRTRRIGPAARHREGAIEVFQAGVARALQGDGVEALTPLPVDTCLHNLDEDVLPRLVVEPNRPVEPASVVSPHIDVAQEIGDGDRRASPVEFYLDIAELGLDQHDDPTDFLAARFGLRGGESVATDAHSGAQSCDRQDRKREFRGLWWDHRALLQD